MSTPTMSEARRYQQLRAHLGYLKLNDAAEALPRILDAARTEGLSLTAALERLLDVEVGATEARKLAGRLRFACLPEPWTINDFDFAAQPGAGQAGILHGDNFNIPAFRWYDKATRTIVVSNHLQHGAATIERQISDGHGLLSREGAARGTLLSGGAVDTLLTCSTAHRRGDEQLAHPAVGLGRFAEARLAVLGAWEGAGEALRLYQQGPGSMREIVSRAAALVFATEEVSPWFHAPPSGSIHQAAWPTSAGPRDAQDGRRVA